MKISSTLQITAHLGSGHFGSVYEAVDAVLGRVAVKIPSRRANESDDEWRARKADLINEGSHIASVEHDRVIRVHSVFEISEQAAHQCATTFRGSPATTPNVNEPVPIMVLGLCRGGSLEAEYQAGPIPLARVRDIATQVAQGLSHIHDKKMLHRDIKPGNILLDTHGRALIGDFGLVTDKLFVGYATGIGYRDHLAPEVIANQLASIKSDLWALGMTIFRLIHGHSWHSTLPRPFDVVLNTGDITKYLSWLPHVPKAWRAFVKKLLEPDSNKRFQSCQAVLAKLAGLPVTPNWACAMSGSTIQWQCARRDRRLTVTLTQNGAKWSWVATSDPNGTGPSKTLRRSDANLTRNKALAELSRFFASVTD